MRSTRPVSDSWGADRGRPIDRFYIERFLAAHALDMRGRVLEVGDARYATQFGQSCLKVDVLDVDRENPRATIVTDLAEAATIPDDTFDCFILIQTLQYVSRVEEALAHPRRILKPGGVLLATVPSISQLDGRRVDRDLWRFTPQSCSLLLARSWPTDDVRVTGHGNVLAATAFLYGLADDELSPKALEVEDARYPLIVCVRAVKQSAP